MSAYSSESTFHERQLMKDPSTASSRIFVGSIPHENVCRKDVEDAFSRFGKVTGVLLNRGFGFVQFDEERSATEAISSTDIMLKGRRLDVKQARVFKGRDLRDEKDRDMYWDDRDRDRERERDRERPSERPSDRDSFRDDRDRDVFRDRSPLDDRGRERRERDERDWRGRERERYDSFGKPAMDRDRFYDSARERFPRDIDYRDSRSGADRYSGGGYRGEMPDARSLPIQAPNMERTNDCEIIVLNKKQTRYAEFIEGRLKKLGLTVDILFPNEDVQMGRVLANISSRGSLYAIMVEPTNEDHRSLTLNILHGVPEAHRNMPLEDAITLVGRNFEAYQAHRSGIDKTASARPNPIPVVPAGRPTAVLVQERHPESIQVLLNLLVDNRTLTVLQYDKVISYLKERRELQVQIELGDANDISTKPPSPVKAPALDKQTELQHRILNILSAKNAQATVSTSAIAAPIVVPAPVPAAVPAPVAAPVVMARAAPVTLPAVATISVPSSVSTSLSSSVFPNFTPASTGAWNPSQPQSATSTSAPILSDPTVQKALDSLMQGNLLQRLVGGVSSANNSAQSLSVLGRAPSQPLFGAYANPTSNSNSNHVGGRRF